MQLQHKISIIAVLFGLLPHFVVAQTGPTDKVDIIKNYEAQLLDANKLNVTPTLPALDTSTKYQDYVVPPRPLKVTYDAPKLKPLGMKAGAKEEMYNGYVKAGGGVPTSIYGEFGYGFGLKDKFDGKIWAKHHQANFKNRENQRFSNTDVQLSGSGMVAKTTALEAKVGYAYDRVHYYGYNDSLVNFDAEQVRQNFKTLDIGLRLFNGERNDADPLVPPGRRARNKTGFDVEQAGRAQHVGSQHGCHRHRQGSGCAHNVKAQPYARHAGH
jgi:hypothetical protein